MRRTLQLLLALGVLVGLWIPAAWSQDAPPSGKVLITTEPPGARVVVNDRRVGVTPAELTVPAGTVLLAVLQLKGYVDHEAQVTVREGEAETLHVVLEPLPTGDAADGADGK